MLVRKLKRGDRLVLGDDVVIQVKKVTGENLSLSIDAPDNVEVLHEKGAIEPDHDAAPAS